MEKIIDNKKIKMYTLKYKIDEIFSIDMTPYMELFLFNKNEHICKADEKLKYLFFFVEGRAKVYTTLTNGKSLLLCFYSPFKVIGDVEFMYYDIANSNVQVIEEVYCIGISFDNIRRLVLDDSKFLSFVCASLGEKLTRLSKYSSINLLYPLENRLASYILGTTTYDKSGNKNNIIFEGNFSEVSELLGTSYRHLLRTLNILCKRDAIKKNTHGYEIINSDILEELAGELYE